MLSRNRVHRFCATSGRQEREDTGKNATTSFAGQRVNKAKEWDFSLMFSVDLTPLEIRSEVIVCCGAARQLSPEIFQRSHPKFFNSFQLFLWEFWRTGLWAFGISLLWYRSQRYISFPYFFPAIHCWLFFFFFVHPICIHFPTVLIFRGIVSVCFLRGFSFISIAIPLLP